MGLSGKQSEQLQSALIDAFPTFASLEQMLLHKLDRNLRAIAGEGSLQDIVFPLIRNANAQGWVEKLIRAACESNPENTKLRVVAQDLIPNYLESSSKSSLNIPSYSSGNSDESVIKTQSYSSMTNDNSNQFDVFLAHNSQDKPQVREIAEELKRRRLKPWLDEDAIPPGRPFQDEIQKAIRLVKSAAIFIGLQGLGKWQLMELRSLISRCVDTNIPVIPILLPGVSAIPDNLDFLKEFNWVDFPEGIDDENALNLLEWGITGTKPQRIPQSEQKPGIIPTEKILQSIPYIELKNSFKALQSEQKNYLVNELLKCRSLNERSSRTRIIEALIPPIPNRVEREGRPREVVFSILEECDNRDGGFQSFLKAFKDEEENSSEFQQAEKTIKDLFA